MKSITESIELEEHCGNMQPKDPWKFAKAVESSQEWRTLGQASHRILFNKGRYFETSIYNKEIINEVSDLTKIPITHNNMLVASWKKLEDFVIAMNCLGIYVSITIDYI